MYILLLALSICKLKDAILQSSSRSIIIEEKRNERVVEISGRYAEFS